MNRPGSGLLPTLASLVRWALPVLRRCARWYSLVPWQRRPVPGNTLDAQICISTTERNTELWIAVSAEELLRDAHCSPGLNGIPATAPLPSCIDITAWKVIVILARVVKKSMCSPSSHAPEEAAAQREGHPMSLRLSRSPSGILLQFSVNEPAG